MILHPALRYVLRRQWSNRLRAWLRRLRTWKGFLLGVLFALSAIGILSSGGLGARFPTEQRAASLAAVLGFMMLMQILSGLGQRGLVFSAADLDQLFPAPFRRRDLLLYQFTTQYVLAILMGILLAIFLGGRATPSLPGLALGIIGFQIFCAHIHAAAAEVSMRLADSVHARLARYGRLPLGLLGVAGVVLLVGVVTGAGDIPARIETALSSPWLRALLHPAEQAVALGFERATPDRLLAAALLLSYVVASFLLVLVIPADILEASYVTSKRVARTRQDLKRGVQTGPQTRHRSLVPTSRRLRGSGAVLWLNALTLWRQRRALVGGVLMVAVMITVIGTQGTGGGEMLFVLLAMVPLWMALPVGFRLPRDQLLVLQQLPLPSTRLAAALVAVPAFVAWGLQATATAIAVLLSHVPAGLVAPLLAGYAAIDATVVIVEGLFALRRSHPQQVNIAQSIAQVLCQFAAVLPGLLLLVLAFGLARSLPLAIAAAALGQAVVAFILLGTLGRHLRRELPTGSAALG